MCPVLRADTFSWMMLVAAVDSQQTICDGNGCGSTASWHPNFPSQCHNCHSPIPSHAADNAANISASPLLSAIDDCALLVTVTEHQLCLPWSHDAVPLTLCLSESNAESESLNVKTESSQDPSATSKRNCNGSTVRNPGLHLKYLTRLTWCSACPPCSAKSRRGLSPSYLSALSIQNSLPKQAVDTLVAQISGGSASSSFSPRFHRKTVELWSAVMLYLSCKFSTCS